MEEKLRIAVLGGGPAGLFIYKRLVDSARSNLEVTVFERKNQLGAGMPYSADGANDEHITNVSGNEIPELATPLAEWIKTVDRDTLNKYCLDPDRFNEYKVLPRLLFGRYLSDQFKLLQKQADKFGIETTVHFHSEVTDIIANKDHIEIQVNHSENFEFDRVVICTGHRWPLIHEGKIPGFYDSPYPPSKLKLKLGHQVAIRGASLTAVDAIRTLARHNGHFEKKGEQLTYRPFTEGFKMVMHSRNGMLPAVRFHLEDSHLGKDTVLNEQQIRQNREANEGFLQLDYVFEQNFKVPIRQNNPVFYARIQDMIIEEFVDEMISLREELDPFVLLKAEYDEAAKSIKRRESVYWKEMLAVLSFTLNYPAKYFSAEDTLRLQKILMPLISLVIAFVPQSSVEELLALHQAGVLTLSPVGENSRVEPVNDGGAIWYHDDDMPQHFETFVDCIGQPHLSYEDLPYTSLKEKHIVSQARLRFRNADTGRTALAGGMPVIKENEHFYLKVPGISINDHFQPVDIYGALNERIYMMAVPFIGGYNPDYSGLDFCEAASSAIIKSLLA